MHNWRLKMWLDFKDTLPSDRSKGLAYNLMFGALLGKIQDERELHEIIREVDKKMDAIGYRVYWDQEVAKWRKAKKKKKGELGLGKQRTGDGRTR